MELNLVSLKRGVVMIRVDALSIEDVGRFTRVR